MSRQRTAQLLARSTPAWYGVAGSPVLDTTRTGGEPSAETACGVLVGSTGQNAQVLIGAFGELAVAHERGHLAQLAVLIDNLGAVGDAGWSTQLTAIRTSVALV